MARLRQIAPRLKPTAPARRQVSDSWRADKTSSTARGYGYRWQQARAEYLREHPHCVMCLAELGMTDMQAAEVVVECARRGVTEPLATVVDHSVPHRGNQTLFWDRNNWQGLCGPHHDRDKQRIERGSQRRRVGLDGWRIDDD